MPRILSLILLVALASLAGCASYSVQREHQAEALQQRRKVWVKENFDDNRAMAVRIAEAFRARGFEVGVGPLTMMPPGFQAVVEYRDAWAWDFRDHLVGLELKLLDPKSSALLAIGRYEDPISMLDTPTEVAGRLVETLYSAGKPKRREG
ncbi:hypothetical protein [Nibricoccus sp. IMCC34717]|uniref:hypothetical protein n=1 Tax=Nibricoccus sp. IMCC34717 TaxID=3034021 RepID=UPI00384AEB21